jgi:hypothetical protein
MNAYDVFGNIAAQEGWTLATQVQVLLGYIENQDSPDAFQNYLQEQCADEENATR